MKKELPNEVNSLDKKALVELSGFKGIDEASMDVVKKRVEAHARKIREKCSQIETFKLTLKPVHEKEKSEKYEVHGLLIDKGKRYVSKVTERNLYEAIDEAMRKILNSKSF